MDALSCRGVLLLEYSIITTKIIYLNHDRQLQNNLLVMDKLNSSFSALFGFRPGFRWWSEYAKHRTKNQWDFFPLSFYFIFSPVFSTCPSFSQKWLCFSHLLFRFRSDARRPNLLMIAFIVPTNSTFYTCSLHPIL